MNETPTALSTIYEGWHTYQIKMVAALEPLSAEQLALRAAPALRSIGEMVTHMIGARARWLMIDEDTPWVRGVRYMGSPWHADPNNH